jgi:hypothetical protein
MVDAPGHRIRALLLALLVALGMSLWFVQGTVMAAAMAVPSDACHHGSSGCDGCSGDGDPDSRRCLALCATAAQALLPGELLIPRPGSRARFQAPDRCPGGCSYRPAHGPPKALAPG